LCFFIVGNLSFQLHFSRSNIVKTKSAFFVMPLILIVSVFVMNCDNATGPTNDTALVGSWNVTTTIRTIGTAIDTPLTPAMLAIVGGTAAIVTFNSNLTYKFKEFVPSLDSTLGTWSSSGSTITLTKTGGTPTSGPYSISGTTLTFTYTDKGVAGATDTVFSGTAIKLP
jgi:hypothetical protein